MNITKAQFTKIINSLIEQDERDLEVQKSLESIASDSYVVFYSPVIEKVISALDYDELISWWFWDGPECGARAEEFGIEFTENGEKVTVYIHNAEDLYDYIERAKK